MQDKNVARKAFISSNCRQNLKFDDSRRFCACAEDCKKHVLRDNLFFLFWPMIFLFCGVVVDDHVVDLKVPNIVSYI